MNPTPWAPPTGAPVTATSSRSWYWHGVALVAATAALATFLLLRPSGPSTTPTPDPRTATMPSVVVLDVVDEVDFPPVLSAEQGGVLTVGGNNGETVPAPVRTCSSVLGWTLDYPSGWYTPDGEFECQAFAPWPEIVTETEVYAAVYVWWIDGPWEDALEMAVPEDRDVVAVWDFAPGGRQALAVHAVQREPGWFDEGVEVYEVFLDAGQKTMVFTTWSAGGDLVASMATVDEIAASFR